MKISSLNKLSDIRSNRPGLTLLHYVAGQAEESNAELLTLPDDFSLLEEAAKTPIDILQVEINKLQSQITKIQNQMKAPNVNLEVKELMSDFLPVSLTKICLSMFTFYCWGLVHLDRIDGGIHALMGEPRKFGFQIRKNWKKVE